MSPDLHELLNDAVDEPVGLPSPDVTWAAGRRRRRARHAVVAAGSVVTLAVGTVVGVSLLDDANPSPPIIEQPSGDATDPASPTEPAPPAGQATLASLAVASTMVLDDGATFESRFPDGTIVRGVADGVTYPERLYGLVDGTVAWRGADGIHVLGPEDDAASLLVPAPTDPAEQVALVGTGQLGDDPVLLVEESRGTSDSDEGATLSAVRADGTREVLLELPVSWEFRIAAADLRGGWLLYTTEATGTTSTILRAADGTETLIDESGEGGSLVATALADVDVAPGVAVVAHHVVHGDPAAPFGEGRLEVRSVTDPTAIEPVTTIPLPTDNVPKQLAVAGEWAYLTLLPDAPEVLQVNLHDGGITRFQAPGVLAVHETLQPRSPNAGPPAACADANGATTGDAQAYVWLPCPEAATFNEDDTLTMFWGVHKLRLVTDPRASTGGVAQRVEAMLEAIFAGPTADEEARGYTAIIDADVDALVGVSFEDGLVTIELTDEGARAVNIGTSARAYFSATVEGAIFAGFVDADRLRFTVEGDCVAWSVYGEGEPECVTRHRDGATTTS